MIDLTPLDVRKKKEDFKRTVRGYDPGQVDAFLDVVSDRLEQLVRDHATLSERVDHLRDSLSTYQERERALNEALLAAQELREEARSQSERDAAVRLREAETHAEAILLDADQAIRHSQRRLEDLRARRRHFLKSLRSMLERYEDYLELEETRLEAEPEDLGDLLERLQTDLGDADEAPRPDQGSDPGRATARGSVSATDAEALREGRGRADAARNGDATAPADARGAAPTDAAPGPLPHAGHAPPSPIAKPPSIPPADVGGSGASD